MQFNDKYEELGDLAMQVLTEKRAIVNETKEDLDTFKYKLTEIGINALKRVKSCIHDLDVLSGNLDYIMTKEYGEDLFDHISKDDTVVTTFPEAGGNKAYALQRSLNALVERIYDDLSEFKKFFNDKISVKIGDNEIPPDPMDREDRLFKKEPPPPKEPEPIPPNMKQPTIPGV